MNRSLTLLLVAFLTGMLAISCNRLEDDLMPSSIAVGLLSSYADRSITFEFNTTPPQIFIVSSGEWVSRYDPKQGANVEVVLYTTKDPLPSGATKFSVSFAGVTVSDLPIKEEPIYLDQNGVIKLTDPK